MAIPSLSFYPKTQYFISNALPTSSQDCSNFTQIIKNHLQKSPFVAFSNLGPQSYSGAPFPLKNKVEDHVVFAWHPTATRKDLNEPQCFLILGSGIQNGQEVVYYAPASYPLDGPGRGNLFRRSPTDQKIYTISMKRFQERTAYLVFPQELMHTPQTSESTIFVTSMPTAPVRLSPQEEKWAQEFLKFPLESILQDQEQNCKQLAQQIFDQLKEKQNSYEAKKSLQRICNSMVERKPDGRLRKQYLEKAWDGVGDTSEFWMS